jgi:hypothetical protein
MDDSQNLNRSHFKTLLQVGLPVSRSAKLAALIRLRRRKTRANAPVESNNSKFFALLCQALSDKTVKN